VDGLEAENAELRRRLGMNSGNSSTPSSKDSMAARAGRKAKRSADRSSRERSADRKPGGQQGHKGSGLTPAAVPDRTGTAEAPAECRGCGADLAGPAAGSSDAGWSWAQVWDILPVVLEKVHWQTSAQRTIGDPCFVMWPRLTLVSDSRCRGVSPAHEHSRAGVVNRVMSPVSATIIAASTGPMPGRARMAW
jgi:hypothetical protein